MSACITVAFNDTCPLGFFCPNSNATHPPQVCMPSRECAIKRAHGRLCEPQGPLEPHACRPGHYCPIGGKQQMLCPAKNFCPVGSYQPLPCGYGTKCHPGAAFQINPVPAYVALAFDILLLLRIGVVLYQRKATAKRRHEKKQETEETGLEEATDGATELQILYPTSVTIIDHDVPRRRRGPVRSTAQAPPDQYEAAILRFIRRARVESGLDFEIATAEGQNNRLSRGCLVGVIGPGKTNFIRILAGQQEPVKKSEEGRKEGKPVSSASGVVSVHINGHHIHPKAFRRIISVVPREAISTPHLTVRENVLHAARMRLPSSFSRSDMHTFVDALITHFDLFELQHSHVGSSKRPVISDAQRRLVDIAMALAAGPTAVFLDEPTAHMNLNEAAALFRLLKFISQQGVTIAVTMNQPTRDVWNNIFLGPSNVNDHTPCAYSHTPTKPASFHSILQLRVASGDRGFPWFQQS